MTATIGLPAQMKGYLFEVVVRRFLAANGWRLISESESDRVMIHNNFKIEIRGRGITHQIDSPCLSDHPMPFVYPLRLIVEAKFYDQEVRKDHMRPFVGLMKDISENYFVAPTPRQQPSRRYTDVGAFFSASGFHREAINLAHAHGIVTVSYRTNPLLTSVKTSITELGEMGFPDRAKVRRAGGLFVFMNDLDRYLGEGLELEALAAKYSATIDDTAALYRLRDSVGGLSTTFIGTTSSGVLLHFLGQAAFPDELFIDTDEQSCQVHFTNENASLRDITMWMEFTKDHESPRRRFYFDVPPGLEEAIRRGQDVLSAKCEVLASIVVLRRIRNVRRTLKVLLDLNWIKQLEQKERRVG